MAFRSFVSVETKPASVSDASILDAAASPMETARSKYDMPFLNASPVQGGGASASSQNLGPVASRSAPNNKSSAAILAAALFVGEAAS